VSFKLDKAKNRQYLPNCDKGDTGFFAEPSYLSLREATSFEVAFLFLNSISHLPTLDYKVFLASFLC